MDELYNIYLDQAKMLHQHKKVWKGHMLKRYLPQVEEIIKEHNIDTNSILDYGCGKSLYHPKGWNATRYDPAVPEFEVKPEKGKKIIQQMVKGEKTSQESSGLSKREWNELMTSFGFTDKIV